MSETIIEEDLNNNSEDVEETNNDENNEHENNEKKVKHVEIELKSNKTQRSDKTKFERAKDSKQRAIEAFKHGEIDPEYRVVKMTNGKFRCYKRKESLTPTPINVNQIQPNKSSNDEVDELVESKPSTKTKSAPKQHNPFDDIVYYNMSNQISEQLNKRLDAVNAEIERLRHKNTKLKGKYKQLKQAIYITEEEEKDEQPIQHEPIQQQQQQIQHEPIQQQPQQPIPQPQKPMIQQIRRTPGINFNRFFN